MADIFDQIQPDGSNKGDIFDEVATSVQAPAVVAPPPGAARIGGASGSWGPPRPPAIEAMMRRADRIKTEDLPQIAATAAMPFTGGGSLAATSAINAALWGSARMASNKLEGRPAFTGAVARDAILGAVPVPKASVGGIISPATLANFAKGAGVSAATVGAATYAQDAIDNKTLTPYNSYKEAFRDALLPSLIGGASLGLSGKLLNNAKMQGEADAGKALMQKLGADNPALGDAVPRYAALQERVSQVNPQIAAKVAKARSPISRAFYQMIGNVPTNEELATTLQPTIRKMDDAEAAYAAAQDKAIKAQQAAEAAMGKMDLPIQVRSQILQQATTDQLNAVSEHARSLIEQQMAADSIGTQTGRAEALKGVTAHLFNARSNAAAAMMEATGIDPKAPIFDKALLASVAKKAMGDRVGTPAGRAIINALESANNNGAKVNATASDLLAKVNPAFRQQVKEQLGIGSDALSLTDFKSLREKLSDSFAGLPDNTLNSAENLASRVYGALGEAIKPSIAAKYGPESLNKYNEFLGFWRTTSQLRDNQFGRALLRGDVTDETVKSLANNLATGKVDETLNFKRFIDTVGQQNKDAATLAYNTLRGAVKNSLLQDATDAAGNVNYKKLGQSLQAIASKKDMPFNVEDFGFGKKEDIAGWNKVLATFKPDQLTPADIQSVMESAPVQKLLMGGSPDIAPRLKTVLAGKAFNKRVLDAAALAEVGAQKQSRDAYGEAVQLAKQAGLSADQAKQAVLSAQNDPVVAAFKGNGSYTLTNEAGKLAGPGTLTDLVANMRRADAATMMNGLRDKQPQLAELVERRLLAGELAKFMKQDTELPGQLYKLDVPRVRSYFNPPSELRADSEVEKLKAVLGKDRVAKFEDFMTNLSKLDDQTRGAILATSGHDPLGNAVGVATAVASGGAMGRAYAKRNAFQWAGDYLKQRRFNMISAALMDDGYLNALNRSSGNVGDALSSLPLQKAYLFLSDKEFLRDLSRGSNDGDNPPKVLPAVTASAPAAAAPSQPQYQEGKVYQDPKTGERKRYIKGQFVDL